MERGSGPLIRELALGSHDASSEREEPLKCTIGRDGLSKRPGALILVTFSFMMMSRISSSM